MLTTAWSIAASDAEVAVALMDHHGQLLFAWPPYTDREDGILQVDELCRPERNGQEE
jgi:hypothetical protein